MAERRSKRARVVDYAALDSGEFIEGVDDSLPKSPKSESVDYKKLSKLILKGDFGDKTKLLIARPEEVESVVQLSGFQSPILVKATGDAGLRQLGIKLPDGELTVDLITHLVGPQHIIPTIDVSTQSEGPQWTMEQWRYYWNMPATARKKLLNVVSLGLFGTNMESQVSAPSVVRDLDLIEKVWPSEDFYPPKVQLYVLMSPQGSYTDFHVDMGGSSVWYHLVRGKKVFLAAPPSAKNLEAFEAWASSEKQGSVFFAERGDGWRRVEMEAGDTLLMPGGWPHAVVTTEDSIAVGGNFQTGQNFTAQVNTWKLEDRLRVRPKFRFPMFKKLMWYAAYHYVQQLQEDKEQSGAPNLSRWEASGLRALVGLLKGWQVQARGDQSDVPAIIPSPDILLHELEELLPPPPSPRLITIKRSDSSASSLDKQPSEKDPKQTHKITSPRAKPGPARQPQKSLGVKGRLLAKMGMKSSAPLFAKPRIHTSKPPTKPAVQKMSVQTGKESDSASKYGALKVQVEKIEPEKRSSVETVKQGNPSATGESVKVPKIVIRGLSGLGSSRGTSGEQPRAELRADRQDSGHGRSPKKVRIEEATRMTSSGLDESDSLGGSEKDFAKLLIRLGKRSSASDTTSRSESPISDAGPGTSDADVSRPYLLTSALAGLSRGGASEGAEVQGVEGKRGAAFAPGHELSRFASACLMTSASRGRSIEERECPVETTGEEGGQPALGERRSEGEAPSTSATAMMRNFLSNIRESSEGGEVPFVEPSSHRVGNVEGRNQPSISEAGRSVLPLKLKVKHSRSVNGGSKRKEAETKEAKTLVSPKTTASLSGREASVQKALPKITVSRNLGDVHKVLSPKAQRELYSPRGEALHSVLLERSNSKLTLGMKTKGGYEKRHAIMLTEVKPDPEVLAHVAQEKSRKVAKPAKKAEAKTEEDPGKSKDSEMELGALENVDVSGQKLGELGRIEQDSVTEAPTMLGFLPFEEDGKSGGLNETNEDEAEELPIGQWTRPQTHKPISL